MREGLPAPEDKSCGNTRIVSGTTGSLEKFDLKEKSLLLKIQMKRVTKPMMWREVEVPADMSILDLHDVIQCVVGLESSHLWQFNERTSDVYLTYMYYSVKRRILSRIVVCD